MYILLDIIEYVMITLTSHQSWLFYSPLAKQAALLKDDLLDPSINSWRIPLWLIWSSNVWRHVPAPQRTPGDPASLPIACLRCCVMKHLKGLELPRSGRELRSNLVYRRFHPLRCRSHARFHYLQPNLRVVDSAGHRTINHGGEPGA